MISIVSGTWNRIGMLQGMVGSVRRDVRGMDYEIIVVDGGSTDGTLEWAREQPDIRLIEQGQRLGSRAAFQAGFLEARGSYVAHLNDDVALIDRILPVAVEQMERSPLIGQVAIPYATSSASRHCERVPMQGKHWLYANFGVTRRSVGESVGWLSDIYYHYGWDTHLSFAIWEAGYIVAELSGPGWIQHIEAKDDGRRLNDLGGGGSVEARKFFEYWTNRPLPCHLIP